MREKGTDTHIQTDKQREIKHKGKKIKKTQKGGNSNLVRGKR